MEKSEQNKKLYFTVIRQIYTACGLGLIPKAPGTFGTLLGIPLFFLFQLGSWKIYLAATLLIFFIGWWASCQGEIDYGQHDDSRIVIDEVLGYLVTMFMVPQVLPLGFIWGFVLFRLFDIWKPGPIGYLDRHCPGGLGVMLDDALAGIFAWVTLRIIASIYFVGPETYFFGL
jgi:phosphatidylglycerophosphatase A